MRLSSAGRVLAVGLLVPVLVAACTSSAKPGKSAGTSSTGGSTGSAGAAVDARTLAANMTRAVDAVTSAHLDIDTGSLAGRSSADLALTNGRTTASDITLTEGGHDVEVVTVGGKSYAKAPAGTTTSGKPWLLVSADSGNAFAKELAATLSLMNAATSLTAVTVFVATAQTFQDKGSDPVNGQPATHYALTVDPSKGSPDPDLAQLLQLLGRTPLPVDVWVDAKNRPVKFSVAVSLGGQKVAITALVSKFDAPLHVTAPPSADVATS
jgi:hypothetical protein